MVVFDGSRRKAYALLVSGIALFSALPAAQAAGDAPPAQVQAVPPSQPWAQSVSDLTVDPAVRFGTLANGVRYAILRNVTPPGQASLWIRIDAGSLMEKDDQLGLAHFMEHMAFGGTKHFPKKDLIQTLQRMGVAFGADLNAFTDYDQTVYQLNLPKADVMTLDTGLLMLRDQGGEALMEPGEIDAERGVIAGEERLRNVPSVRVQKVTMPYLFKGLKFPDRFPIGDLNIIRTAQRDRFVNFYDSYYRPSRATVIAVGDFDVDATESRIRKTFGDWRPRGAEGAAPDLGTLVQGGEAAKVVVEGGVPLAIGLTWVREPDRAPDTRAAAHDRVVKFLGLAVFNRRLEELSRTDDPPFILARSETSSVYNSAEISAVSAQPLNDQWQRTLDATEQELRRLLQYGVTAEELQREVTTLRTWLEEQVKEAATRNTRALAGELLASVSGRRVFVSPQTELALFETTVEGLAPDHVNAALGKLFAGNDFRIVLTSPVPVAGGEAAVIKELRRSQQVAVTAPQPAGIKPWPYTDFGRPGAVVSRRPIPGFDATLVTFANGTTLAVKPTTFQKGDIQVDVQTGAGDQNFSPDKIDPRRVLIDGLRGGGLGKLTVDEVTRALTGHVYGGGLSTADDRFDLSGSTRPQDLQLEMQFLAAHLTDPAYRANDFNKTKASFPSLYPLSFSTPAGVFRVEIAPLLAGGDQRQSSLTPVQLASISMEAHRAELKPLLEVGPIQVTMVGDLTVEQAIRATSTTFGALPTRPAVPPAVPGAGQRHFPAPTPEVLKFHHKGEQSQSLGFVSWPLTADVTHDSTELYRLGLLREVVKVRATDEIRERLALAYAPQTPMVLSDFYKDYGYLAVSAQTAPDKLPAFYAAADAIVKELQDRPVSADILKRAREPLIAAIRRSLKSSNGVWLGVLENAADRPWFLPQFLEHEKVVQAVTPADIQALARKYLRPETAWRAEVLPEAASGAQAGDAAAGAQ